MVIKLYIDMRSPSCRSVLKFVKVSEIPFEIILTDVLKGEQFKPEFSSKFPLKKVPALEDGDFLMSESVAICRYLSNKFPGQFPDFMYPADPQKRAKVDQYLAFHHEGVRNPITTLVITTAITAPMTGQMPPEDEVSKQTKACEEGLDIFTEAFLGGGDKSFILGDEVSLADVFFANELVDSFITGVNFLEGRPKLEAYFRRVQTRLSPHFDAIDEEFYQWVESVKRFRESKQ